MVHTLASSILTKPKKNKNVFQNFKVLHFPRVTHFPFAAICILSSFLNHSYVHINKSKKNRKSVSRFTIFLTFHQTANRRKNIDVVRSFSLNFFLDSFSIMCTLLGK